MKPKHTIIRHLVNGFIIVLFSAYAISPLRAASVAKAYDANKKFIGYTTDGATFYNDKEKAFLYFSNYGGSLKLIPKGSVGPDLIYKTADCSGPAYVEIKTPGLSDEPNSVSFSGVYYLEGQKSTWLKAYVSDIESINANSIKSQDGCGAYNQFDGSSSAIAISKFISSKLGTAPPFTYK